MDELKPIHCFHLGLDCSTQQLKAVILNNDLQIVYENQVKFDEELCHYKTKGGVHYNENDKTATAPPLMWVEATGLLLDKIKSDNFNISHIVSISGAAQQHGSVYWKKGSKEKLLRAAELADEPLHGKLSDSFSVPKSPIWMDSSTKKQCEQMRTFLGGDESFALHTGSKLFERFSGAQILKLIQTMPEAYTETERISLVSSFMASLFVGDFAPTDYSDGCGMGLVDIVQKKLDSHLCQCLNPELEAKIGPLVSSETVIGPVSSYMVKRYGFNANCKVVAFTGDNPASLAGMRLKKGDICLSLGSSDTLVFWNSSLPKRVSDAITQINPVDSEAFMSFFVYKNASFLRERMRDQLASGSWKIYSDMLSETPLGNNGNIGIFLDLPEITPQNVQGRFFWDAEDRPVSEESFSPAETLRAALEGQFIAKRAHFEQLGITLNKDSKILATGGASCNLEILQIVANCFGANVYTADISNSAALGSAYRAKHGLQGGHRKIPFHNLVDHIENNKLISSPVDYEERKIYDKLVARYKILESELVKKQTR